METVNDLSAARLLAADVGSLSNASVGAHLVDLHRLRAMVDARIVAATGVFDSRGAWACDGARTGPSWITARTGAPHHRAKGDVRLGRGLRSTPVVEAAFAGGDLSREQVDALLKAREGIEEVFAAVEEVLVDEVSGATVAAGLRFLRRWAAEVRERLGLDGADGSAPGDSGSKLHLSQTFEGRWVLDATLDTEQGEIVANAIDAVVDAMFRDGQFRSDDGLGPAERRAIALVEVVTRGTVGGEDDATARPLVVGIMDLRPDPDSAIHGPTLADDEGMFGDLPAPVLGSAPLATHGPRVPGVVRGLAEAERAGVISRATVERWICEGTFQPVFVGPGADELNMGRKVRVATRAQRRALRVRDGHCVFAGCSAEASQCQAHHVVEDIQRRRSRHPQGGGWGRRTWEHDGPTDLDNLVLLCRYHHRMVHDHGFTVSRIGGRVEIRRPDGTLITGTRTVRCDHRRGRPPPPRARDPISRPPRCRVDAASLSTEPP